MIRSIGSAVLAGALAVLAASATALADGALLSPATLSDAPAGYLTVAMAPNGYAVAAWNQPVDGGQFAVAVATRPPGGHWSRPEFVGASGYDKISPSAAVSASGDVAVAWEEIISFQGHAFVASRAAGGTFTSAEELTDAAAVESPTVGIDVSGRVTLLYVPAPALVEREFAAGTSALAAAPQLLYDGGTYGCIGAQIAVAPSGDAVADAFCDLGALFALRRGGVWHVSPVIAGDAGPPCPGPSTSRTAAGVAIDAQGHAVGLLATEEREGIDFGGLFCTITRTTDTLQLVVPVGDVMTPVVQPIATGSVDSESPALVPGQVSVSPSGILAAWAANDAGAMRLKVRDFALDGTATGAEQTLDPGANVLAPRLAVGADGRALLAWSHNEGFGVAAPLEVATRPPGGAFAAPVEATPANGGAIGVALDASSDGAVGYLDGTTRFVQVRGFDAAPPVLSGVTIPASALAGETVTFAASAFDVWSPFAPVWSFGDGAVAAGTSATHAYARPGTYTATLTAPDLAGNVASRSGTVQVLAPSGGAGAPVLSAVSLTHRRFRAGRAPTAISARRRHRSVAPVGTTFRFTLDRAASVKIAFARHASGLRSGRRCVKPSRRLRRARARRCTRLVAITPALVRALPAGADAVPFSGRVGRRALAPGRYVATLTASANGRAGTPSRLRFTVVR
jgi:hypothetical protein